ncbi:Mlh2-like protein [Giardia duodenalis ATCC 50581]|uniref:Mlh2-like protein n=2 Tax=Giardia intestinalis TaxID=5741 RepID=C6LNV6_GIAIB|nr:Mlh2-like protein [Giardia intestinalis ATCC 50581]
MVPQRTNSASSHDTQKHIRRLSPLDIIRLNSLDCANSPADVVKELIENSLDAGATSVKVFYSYYGYREITVYDNGSGISGRDDSFEVIANSNCTSKIRVYDEIFSVQTYGFRGNALMWISLKGELQIFSRGSKGAEVLRAIYVNGGLFSIVPIRAEDEEYVLRSFVGHTNIDVSGRFTIIVVSNLGDSFHEYEVSPSAQRSELEDTIKRYSIPHYDKEFILYDTDLNIPILTLEKRLSVYDRLFDVRRDIFASTHVEGGQPEVPSGASTGTLSHLVTRSSTLYISEEELLQSPFYVAIRNKHDNRRSFSASISLLPVGSHDTDICTQVLTVHAAKTGDVCGLEAHQSTNANHRETPKRALSTPSFLESSIVPTLPSVPDTLWYADAILKKDKATQLRLVPQLTPLLLASCSTENPSLPMTSPDSGEHSERCRSAKASAHRHLQPCNAITALHITIHISNPMIQPVARKASQQKALINSLVIGKTMINNNLAILLYYNKRPVILKRLFEEIHACVNSYFKEIYGPNLLLILMDAVQGTCFCDLDRTPEKKFITFGKFIGRLLQDRILRMLSSLFSKNLGRKRVRLNEHQRLLAKANMFGDSLDISNSASSHALRLLGGPHGSIKVDPARFLDFDYRLNLFFEKCTQYLYERIFEGAAGGEYHSGVTNLDSHAATRHINNNVIVKTIKLYREEFKTFDPYAMAHRNISKEIADHNGNFKHIQACAPKLSPIDEQRALQNCPNVESQNSGRAEPNKSAQVRTINKVTTDIMKRILGCDFHAIRKLDNPAKKNYKAMFLSTYLLYGSQYALIKSFAMMRPDLISGILQLVPNVSSSLKCDLGTSLSVLSTIFNSINTASTSTTVQYSKVYALSTYQESSDWLSEVEFVAKKPSSSIFALRSRRAVHSFRRKQKETLTALPSPANKLINSAPDVQLSMTASLRPSTSFAPTTVSNLPSPLLEYVSQFSIRTAQSAPLHDDCTDISEALPHEPTGLSTSSESSRSPSLSASRRNRLKLSTLTIPSDDATDFIESAEVQDNSETLGHNNSEPCEVFNPISEAEKSIQSVIERRDLTLSSEEEQEDNYHKLKKFTQVFDLGTIKSRFHHLENHIIFVLEEELKEKRPVSHILGPSPREAQAIREKQKRLSDSSGRRGLFTETDIKTMGKQRLDAMSDAISSTEPISLARINSYIQSQKTLISKAELNTGNLINIDGTIVAYYNLDNYCCNLNATRVTTKVFKIIFLKYWLGNAVKSLYDPSVSFHKIPLMRVPVHYNVLIETFIDLFLALGIGVSIADNKVVVAPTGVINMTSIPSQTCIQLLVHPLLLVSEYYQCFKLLFEANKTAVPTESDFEQFLAKIQLLLFYDHLEAPEPVSIGKHRALQKRLGILNHGHPIRIEYLKDINYTIPYSNETIKLFIHYYCEFLATHFIRVAYEIQSAEIIKAYFRLIIDHLNIEDLDTPYKMPIYTENETSTVDQMI